MLYLLLDCILFKSIDILESFVFFVIFFDLVYSWGWCCCVYIFIFVVFIFEKRNFLFGGIMGVFFLFWNCIFVWWGVLEIILLLKSKKWIGDREIWIKRLRSNWGMIKLYIVWFIVFFYWVIIFVVYGCINGVWSWLILVLIEWVMSVIFNF